MEKDFRRIGNMDMVFGFERDVLADAICKDGDIIYDISPLGNTEDIISDIEENMEYLLEKHSLLLVETKYKSETVEVLYKGKYILVFDYEEEYNDWRKAGSYLVYSMSHLHVINDYVQAKIKLLGQELVTIQELKHFILNGKCKQIF